MIDMARLAVRLAARTGVLRRDSLLLQVGTGVDGAAEGPRVASMKLLKPPWHLSGPLYRLAVASACALQMPATLLPTDRPRK
jgi:hypothetical protein